MIPTDDEIAAAIDRDRRAALPIQQNEWTRGDTRAVVGGLLLGVIVGALMMTGVI